MSLNQYTRHALPKHIINMEQTKFMIALNMLSWEK
jgi:hypothetical protein